MQIPNGRQISNVAKGILTGDVNHVTKSFFPEMFSEQDLRSGVTFVANTSPDTYRGAPNDLWEFSIDGDGFNYFKYAGISSAQYAFNRVPQLQAVIMKKASALTNGRTWILDRKSKESTGYIAAKLRRLLLRPNPLQTWSQFEAQGYIYEQVFGYSIMLAVKGVGWTENIDASSLWNIPPNMCVIKENKNLFYQTDTKGMIEEIVLNYRGERTTLNLDDVLIIKDFTPSFESMIIPCSRIQALEMPLNNIMGAYQSRGTLIHYRGALGIFSQDNGGSGSMGALPMTPEQKDDLQRDLRKYGLKKNQIQFIITKAALKWQQVGVPVRDLMLFEEIKDDTEAICDEYNFPTRLMAGFNANSLGGSDANTFTRNLYDNAIVPEARNRNDQLSRFFRLEDDYGLRLDKDFSHIGVMQADKVQEAQARKISDEAYEKEFLNNLITLNQWLVKLGEDPRPTDGDLYYTELLAKGYTFGAKAAPAQNANNGTETETGSAAASGS